MAEDGDSSTFWSLTEFMSSWELDELWPGRALVSRPWSDPGPRTLWPRHAPPGGRRRAPSHGHPPTQFWRPWSRGTHWPPQADRGWLVTTGGRRGEPRGGGGPGAQCPGCWPRKPPTSSLLRPLGPGTVWGGQKTDIQVGSHHHKVLSDITSYRHPLFPLLALLFEKCELATQSAECPSSDSFNVDIQAFVQHQQQEKRPLLAESEEANELVSSNRSYSASAA